MVEAGDGCAAFAFVGSGPHVSPSPSPENVQSKDASMTLTLPPELQTTRLLGRPATDGDMGYLRHILGSPQTMMWLSADGKAADEPRMLDITRSLSGHWKAHGFGVRLFFLRGSGAFAGWAGIRYVMLDGAPELELLYSLRHSLWREGLGSEMARACLEEVRATGLVRSVVAYTQPHNAASLGVMRACGMSFERTTTVAGLPHVVHRLRWPVEPQATDQTSVR